jgi:hypothetical protein
MHYRMRKTKYRLKGGMQVHKKTRRQILYIYLALGQFQELKVNSAHLC